MPEQSSRLLVDPVVGEFYGRQVAMRRAATFAANVAHKVALGRWQVAASYRRMAQADGPRRLHYLERARHFELLAARAQRFADDEFEYLARLARDRLSARSSGTGGKGTGGRSTGGRKPEVAGPPAGCAVPPATTRPAVPRAVPRRP